MPADTDLARDALDELAGSGCPTPADLIEDLTPAAQLLLVHDLAYEVMSRWSTDAAVALGEGVDDLPEAARALQGIMVAAGALDQAMVALGLLPPEAVMS